MAWKPLKVLPYDGKHDVSEKLPIPNTLLCIDCKESIGGVATLGDDGKWYWSYDYQMDEKCDYTVKNWRYFGYPGPDADTIAYLTEKYEED